MQTSPGSEHLRQLSRWGGFSALGGVIMFLGAVIVVVGMGLPDASDPETLADFDNIEGGRIAEHFFYLSALMMFALHAVVLYRLLRPSHIAAALFGAVVSAFGLAIMAGSSMLHVSTAPLFDLYDSPDALAQDREMIEYAWHAAQSVFDTMLTTGVLLVPVGIVLFGLAMLKSPLFGRRVTWLAIGLGIVGILGAVVEVIDTGSDLSAASVLAIVVFNLIVGSRTLMLGRGTDLDLTAEMLTSETSTSRR